MKKNFNLTLDLPFGDEFLETGIVFSKFLPRKKESIKINKNGFEISIYFSYKKDDLQHISNDFIKRQKDIKKHINIMTKSLRLEFNKEIDEKLYQDLANENLSPESKILSEELKKTSIELYNAIFDYTRNSKKQIWIKRSYYNMLDLQNFFLKTKATWTYEGTKKSFKFKKPLMDITITLDDSLEKNYISKKSWDELSDILSNNKTSSTEDLFIADSLEHLNNNNYRMAIIESVIALEHSLKNNNCENIETYLPTEDSYYIKKLFFEKKQFSIPTEIVLIKMKKQLEEQNISPELILKIINKRNEIINSGSVNIANEEARELVENVIKLIIFLKKNTYAIPIKNTKKNI